MNATLRKILVSILAVLIALGIGWLAFWFFENVLHVSGWWGVIIVAPLLITGVLLTIFGNWGRTGRTAMRGATILTVILALIALIVNGGTALVNSAVARAEQAVATLQAGVQTVEPTLYSEGTEKQTPGPTSPPASMASATATLIPATATPTALAANPALVPSPTPTIAPQLQPTTTVGQVFYDAEISIKGGFPEYADLRAHVRQPGDTSYFLVKFPFTFQHLVLLRLVGDDIVTEVSYHSTSGPVVDLLPLLKMGPVSATEPADELIRKYMEARGVNLAGEQLNQNYVTVFLGNVQAGSYIVVGFKDDPTLQVNSGGLISFSVDTDPMSVDLTGTVIKDPTFVITGTTPTK